MRIFYQEMNEGEKSKYEQISWRLLGELINFYSASCERAIKVLILFSGGGIISTLTYLHASQLKNNCMYFPLVAFIIGFFFAVILVVVDFHVSFSNIEKFGEDTNKFKNNEIGLDQVRAFSKDKKFFLLIVLIGYFSFFCSVVGTISGILGLKIIL